MIISITNFGEGISDDYTTGGVGEFSITKHFDILTYPNRLQPLRGMVTESVTNSKIGNIIVASDGLMYAVGTDVNNPTLGTLWCRVGYGASDVWTQRGTNIAALVVYNLLVEHKSEANGRTMIFAGANKLAAYNPTTGNSDTLSLSFTNIGQGFVHPKDAILYIPYDNKVGTIGAGAALSAFATAQFTAPTQYQIPCITNHGNYLAIPAYTGSGSGTYSSIVYLWDTTNSTWNESIPWGQGQLKILNNLGGVLIGISTLSSNYNGSVQDADKIIIKVCDGGQEPTTIKELKVQRLTTTAPSVAINPNVNFVYNNRLYFSVNLVNGGTAPAYYGLWSVGKNKYGRWTVTMERTATSNNSDTGVLAAAIAGDFAVMAHTAVGTLTYTENGNNLSAIFDNTSVYESVINPEMSEGDKQWDKKLIRVWATYLPLPVDATVVMQYRVDGSANSAWTTIFTETIDNQVLTDMSNANGTEFTDGRNYEFRLTSTDGAIITGYGYEYKVKPI